jgi:hypothetical protein
MITHGRAALPDARGGQAAQVVAGPGVDQRA